MDLNTAWFFLIGILFAGYAALDGFDLGVGILSLFSRNEKERDLHISAIAPVWDGNEVWLLAGGGALFAAFPKVYATVFSGFYLALMLVLLCLILRAVSLEFRGQVTSEKARTLWGWMFGVSSLVVSILFGVALGNILRGIPIDAAGNYTGTFFDLLNPLALLMGVLSLVFFVMHGAAYMAIKTDGDLRDRMFRRSEKLVSAAAVIYILAIAALFLKSPFLFSGKILPWAAVLLTVAGFLLARWGARSDRALAAFLGSALAIISVTATFGLGLYPTLAPSIINPEFSLTAYNASSTPRTLMVMLWIALLGMPLVLTYTGVVYWLVRGKASGEYHHF